MKLLKGGSGLRALGGDWRTRQVLFGVKRTGEEGAGWVYVGAEALSCGLVLYESSSSAPLLSSIGGLCTFTEPWARLDEWVSSPSQNNLPGTSETREIEIVKISICIRSVPNTTEQTLFTVYICSKNLTALHGQQTCTHACHTTSVHDVKTK